MRSIRCRLFAICAAFCTLISASACAQSLAEANKTLYTARYNEAADLFRKHLAESPQDPEAHYGLVRALLSSHRAKEAYAAAENAGRITPPAPGTLTAVGLAGFRRGEITTAEQSYRAALKLDPNYPGAIAGLASIYSTVSKFKTARQLMLAGYKQAPDDPEFKLAYANSLKGNEHIAELEKILAGIDPASELAMSLRSHIANDKATGDRKLRRLASPYERTQIKMHKLLDGPNHFRGFGVQAQLNGKHTVRLLLDTGASGIAIAPKAAEKAGLEALGDEVSETKGIGDQKAQSTLAYIASELRVGGVAFADYPIRVFRSAQSSDFDGLIGPDVFDDFIVNMDFPNSEITLEPRPDRPSLEGPVDSSNAIAPGFHRVYRFGDHLLLPTSMNEKKTGLFLVDSGASLNLIDAASAKETTAVSSDDRITVKGIQGRVDKVSRADRVSLVFAGFRQDNPDLVAFDLTNMSDSAGIAVSGVLGMPVLSHLKVSIDYLEGTLKLEYQK